MREFQVCGLGNALVDIFLDVSDADFAALGFEPDLDDGVALNIAPFHELTPWKDAKAYWKELLDGDYPWSTIGKRLRPRDAGTSPGRSAGHG